MTELEIWLEPRLAGVPESLRRRILAAVRRYAVSSQSTAHRSQLAAHSTQLTAYSTQLTEIAENLLSEAKSAPPARDTALTLLAADALITYACEALGEGDPERLGEMG